MKYVIAVIACFVIWYLMGSFVELNLDLTEWDKSSRIFPCFMAICSSFALCMAIWSNKK